MSVQKEVRVYQEINKIVNPQLVIQEELLEEGLLEKAKKALATALMGVLVNMSGAGDVSAKTYDIPKKVEFVKKNKAADIGTQLGEIIANTKSDRNNGYSREEQSRIIKRIQNILPPNKRKNMLIVQDIWLKLSRALQGDAKAMNSALDKIEKFISNFNRNS